MEPKQRFQYEVVPLPLTYALILIILVYEDVVQDKVEQLVLQSAIRVKNQWLEALPATRSQLVTEDHQQVTEKHERLNGGTKEELRALIQKDVRGTTKQKADFL